MNRFKCKYCVDETCVHGDCPLFTEFCPLQNDPYVCKWEDRSEDNDS